ncbi:MAG: phage terminase small subunit P27 family [Anaerolineae bacterium]|nr:phage terminase small subunit P27 family [Anaerolineae bacterium]
MPVGRPPKPKALKELQGNPGKRAISKNEPAPERVIPAMPRGLPPRAKRFWKDHIDKLDRLGLLTEVDGTAFTMMAIHYAMAWNAMERIFINGLSRLDENGVERKNPLLQVWRENSAAYLRYAQQFGLTPSARGRLSIPEPPSEDDYEAFLNG